MTITETIYVKESLSQKERRERIATAAMQGFAASDIDQIPRELEDIAKMCVSWADALIAELDKDEKPS